MTNAERRAAGLNWQGDGALVFVDRRGRPLYPSAVSNLMAELVAKAGLPHMRLHDLRHLHATTLLSELPFLPSGWRTPVDAQTRNRIVWTGLAGIAATILNPFGIRGALFPIELLSRFGRGSQAFRMIGEFQPPFSGYFVTLSITAYQVLVVVDGLLCVLDDLGCRADVVFAADVERGDRVCLAHDLDPAQRVGVV